MQVEVCSLNDILAKGISFEQFMRGILALDEDNGLPEDSFNDNAKRLADLHRATPELWCALMIGDKVIGYWCCVILNDEYQKTVEDGLLHELLTTSEMKVAVKYTKFPFLCSWKGLRAQSKR